MGRIQKDLKQTKPLSLEAEVFVNVLRTADVLMRGESELLRSAALSSTQYNVLRILRGARPGGLRCAEVGDRLITRDPDVTRLLDRLEERGLIQRTRSVTDRRVVKTSIMEAGLAVLAGLDVPMEELHRQQLAHVSKRALKALSSLLDDVRSGTGGEGVQEEAG